MDELSCTVCSGAETRQKSLQTAARHPALKGSRFVGSRGVRDLHVCRECGAMWQTWYDNREGYQAWRSAGRTIVPVFANDTSLTRLVDWVAAQYSETSYALVASLATKLIRRRPKGLQDGTKSLVRHIGELSPPANGTAAERLTMLFHVSGLVVERAIRGDLRPSGPRVKPPIRYNERDREEAARQFRSREVDGLTRLPRTHDVVGRLMWESRWGSGPDSPQRAVVAIHDPSPILRFLDELPLTAVSDGILRGIYAEAAFKAAGKLNNLGRLPENDHAVWLPRDAWTELERLVDPLERLAATIRRIREAVDQSAAERLARIRMESLLVREPIQKGVRFTDVAIDELESFARRLESGRHPDDASARTALREILDLEQRGREADERCVLTRD